MQDPLAFHLTWTTFGTWLPGDERGWVDGQQPGIQAHDAARKELAQQRIRQEAVILTPDQREIVIATIQAHCGMRQWTLHALNARSNHVHVVVSGDRKPDEMMDQFKAYCSRHLNEQAGEKRRWWTKHGSTKWIFDEKYLNNAIRYVLEQQDRGEGKNAVPSASAGPPNPVLALGAAINSLNPALALGAAKPRVKICGITTVADALHAAALGADAIGLNCYPRSPRYVSPDAALAILEALPPFVDPVALFVNESLAALPPRVQALGGIRTIQWHGDQPEAPPAWPYHYIPAFAVPDTAALERVRCFLDRCRELGRLPAAVLIDGHRPGVYGGTGQLAAWDLLAGVDLEVPLILAGGLTPDNVAEAVRRVRPYAVDVAGGVEIRPGVKDPEKIRCFVVNARAGAV